MPPHNGRALWLSEGLPLRPERHVPNRAAQHGQREGVVARAATNLRRVVAIDCAARYRIQLAICERVAMFEGDDVRVTLVLLMIFLHQNRRGPSVAVTWGSATRVAVCAKLPL